MSTSAPSESLPPEVAELGQPEEVVDLAVGKMSGNAITAVLGGVVGMLLCFVIAIPLFVCGINPFGANAPPPHICFSVAGVVATLGLASAWAAYYYAFEVREKAAAYRFYADFLVIVAPDRSVRKIRWGQIGPQKQLNPMNPKHVFPVDGEADFAFDFSNAEHEALAGAIERKSASSRWTQSASPTVTAALTAGRVPPAFLLFDSADSGLFRVSLVGGQLLFLRVATGSAGGTRGIPARPVPVQGGIAGGMNGWMQMKAIERMQQTLDAVEGADERRLFELAGIQRGSKMIAPQDLRDVHISSAGVWAKMSTAANVVAVLTFTHPEWGAKKMYFESRQQLTEGALMLSDAIHKDLRPEALQAMS